jgi:hypothetical protein
MSQWGTFYWEDQYQKSWRWIAEHYYNADGNPSGLRSSFLTSPIEIQGVDTVPSSLRSGDRFSIDAEVTNHATTAHSHGLLGASLYSPSTGYISVPPDNAAVKLVAGTGTVSRYFDIPPGTPAGVYDLLVAVWLDIDQDGLVESEDLRLDRITLAGRMEVQSSCQPAPRAGAENEIFKDMPPGSFAYNEANILYANGITHGCRNEPKLFCPSCPVKRSHMAAFIVRSVGWPLVNPASATFSDVPTTHMFYREIETLKAHKVTYGCGSGKYCPDSHVTRGQMAAFLRRAAGWPTVVPATPSFNDVPASYLFYADIETIYAHGVTHGCGNGNYCPDSKLTRAQAAIFLVRTFNLK